MYSHRQVRTRNDVDHSVQRWTFENTIDNLRCDAKVKECTRTASLKLSYRCGARKEPTAWARRCCDYCCNRNHRRRPVYSERRLFKRREETERFVRDGHCVDEPTTKVKGKVRGTRRRRTLTCVKDKVIRMEMTNLMMTRTNIFMHVVIEYYCNPRCTQALCKEHTRPL